MALVAVVLIVDRGNSDATPHRLTLDPTGYTSAGPTQHLADAHGVVDGFGYAVTVNGFSRTNNGEGTQLCASVTYSDTGPADGTSDFFLDWTLRLANGNEARPNPDGHIQSGTPSRRSHDEWKPLLRRRGRLRPIPPLVEASCPRPERRGVLGAPG